MYGIKLLPYGVLAGGFLSGKYLGGAQPEGARHSKIKEFQSRYASPKMHAAAEKYKALAESKGLTLTQLAVAWCASERFLWPARMHSARERGAVSANRSRCAAARRACRPAARWFFRHPHKAQAAEVYQGSTAECGGMAGDADCYAAGGNQAHGCNQLRGSYQSCGCYDFCCAGVCGGARSKTQFPRPHKPTHVLCPLNSRKEDG